MGRDESIMFITILGNQAKILRSLAFLLDRESAHEEADGLRERTDQMNSINQKLIAGNPILSDLR